MLGVDREALATDQAFGHAAPHHRLERLAQKIGIRLSNPHSSSAPHRCAMPARGSSLQAYQTPALAARRTVRRRTGI